MDLTIEEAIKFLQEAGLQACYRFWATGKSIRVFINLQPVNDIMIITRQLYLVPTDTEAWEIEDWRKGMHPKIITCASLHKACKMAIAILLFESVLK